MLHARLELDTTLDSVYKLDSLDRETRQLLDSSTPRHMQSASTASTATRQELDRLDRQGLDSASTVDSTAPRRSLEMKSEYRSVNRNCCLGIWNLYFVFQFPNRRARCVSWILHGDIWILKSVQVPKSAARRGIWILDGPRRFLETGNCSPLCF